MTKQKTKQCLTNFILIFIVCRCGEAPAESLQNDVVEVATPMQATAKVSKAKNAIVETTFEAIDIEEIEPISDEIHFAIESRDRGGYYKDGPWVTIAYENKNDESNVITASRIAYAASMLLTVWEEWEYPNLEAVREKLSNFYVIAVHVPRDSTEPSNTLALLRYPDIYKENQQRALEKTGDLGAFCFPSSDKRLVDIPDKAKFVIVIKAYFLNLGWMDTVVHEILHPTLLAAFSDADGNHERDDIWLRNSEEGVMAEVLSRLPY